MKFTRVRKNLVNGEWNPANGYLITVCNEEDESFYSFHICKPRMSCGTVLISGINSLLFYLTAEQIKESISLAVEEVDKLTMESHNEPNYRSLVVNGMSINVPIVICSTTTSVIELQEDKILELFTIVTEPVRNPNSGNLIQTLIYYRDVEEVKSRIEAEEAKREESKESSEQSEMGRIEEDGDEREELQIPKELEEEQES